jgi:hypothetical protein
MNGNAWIISLMACGSSAEWRVIDYVTREEVECYQLLIIFRAFWRHS